MILFLPTLLFNFSHSPLCPHPPLSLSIHTGSLFSQHSSPTSALGVAFANSPAWSRPIGHLLRDAFLDHSKVPIHLTWPFYILCMVPVLSVISWFICLLSSHCKMTSFRQEPCQLSHCSILTSYNTRLPDIVSTTINIHEMSKWIFSCFSSPADRPWSICRHRPLSFHAHPPSLIPDITSHQNDCGCLLFPLMESLLPLLPPLPASAVSPRPVLQGLAEALPPNPPGLLLLPSFPSELHQHSIPALNPYLATQSSSISSFHLC